MKTILLSFALVGTACAGFVAWRVHVARIQETPHFEILLDPSLSHGAGCETLIGLASQAVRREKAAPHSTLTVLLLGDKRTANEPWPLARYAIPKTRRALEGRKARAKRQEELLSDLSEKCKTIRPTHTSPIFLGVEQAVSDLRSKGCMCWVCLVFFVYSDLEENAEASIKDQINGEMFNDWRVVLPDKIDNDGITIFFCGLATTTQHGNTAQLARRHTGDYKDRLQQIWLRLFTSPEVVRFAPYCPGQSR